VASPHEGPSAEPLAVSTPSSSRKRKASLSPSPEDDPMSTSPAMANARLPASTTPRSIKRARPNLTGKPLSIPRLLETLDAKSLRSIVQTLCDRHGSAIQEEIRHLAPRPSVSSTLQVLREYQHTMNASFPIGDNPGSDYSYNRVRQHLITLLDALSDFTPQFLPPVESQSSTSLTYLDGVMNIIHELPRWDSASHNLAKENAYEEIARAWVLVIREAGKRGGGIQLQYGGWDDKLRRHNELAGGKLAEAVNELRQSLGWMATGRGPGMDQHESQSSIRQQLFSGTYGQGTASMRAGTGW
jgi:protein Cut8